MTDLAHQRPDGDLHFAPASDASVLGGAPASGPGDDAFRDLVAVLRCLPVRPTPEGLTIMPLVYDAAAAGALILRARGGEPEAMLVQLKQALAVGVLPLSVAGLADELSAGLVRHAIAAYYDER